MRRFALREDGLRDHHGQLQPGDRLHRLRHLRPALLRAAHPRGRAAHHRSAEKPEGVIVQFGGQTPLNLAVPLERAGVPIIGTSPESIDRAEDRERFEQVLTKLQLKRPAERDRAQRPGGRAGRRADRLPGAGAPVLRAGRPRHGDRLRPEQPRALHAARGARVAGAPGADRQVPGGRHRGRRRRRQRRHEVVDRRHHGAHRARRRPLGRQRLLAAAVLARRRGADRHPPPDRCAGARAAASSA